MIRRAEVKDVKPLIQYEYTVFDYDRLEAREVYHFLDIPDQNEILLDLDGGGDIVGYGIIRYMKAHPRTAWLYSIASSAKRGHKILRLLEELAQFKNKTKIRLEVRLDNKQAIDFYYRNGYECRGLITCFYSDGSDALRYEKEI